MASGGSNGSGAGAEFGSGPGSEPELDFGTGLDTRIAGLPKAESTAYTGCCDVIHVGCRDAVYHVSAPVP
ncbi:MAG: hypothetical protein IKP54_01615 [Bacteroidales bacterium]|nr:hypothetical protein [Bacteroidales bacterium]